MIEIAIGLVILVVGGGGAGVGLAWLNDRRHAAKARLPTPDPKAVLADRFVRGDIDELEFNRRMHALTYGPPLQLGND